MVDNIVRIELESETELKQCFAQCCIEEWPYEGPDDSIFEFDPRFVFKVIFYKIINMGLGLIIFVGMQ